MRRLDLKQYIRTPLFCSQCLAQPLEIVSLMAVTEYLHSYKCTIGFGCLVNQTHDVNTITIDFIANSLEIQLNFCCCCFTQYLCVMLISHPSIIFAIFFPIQLFIFRTLSYIIACSFTGKRNTYITRVKHSKKRKKKKKQVCNDNWYHGNREEVSNMCANNRLPTCEIEIFRFIFSIIHTVKRKSDWSISFLKEINWIMTISVLFALNYRKNDFVFFFVSKIATNSQWKSINQSVLREKWNEKQNHLHHSPFFLYSKRLNSARPEFAFKKFSGFGDFSKIDTVRSLFFFASPTQRDPISNVCVNRYLNFSRLGRFIAVSCIKNNRLCTEWNICLCGFGWHTWHADFRNTVNIHSVYTVHSVFKKFKSNILFVCVQ